MMLGGDERGRTQGGNNNAWCQDNETSWFDWEHRRRPRRACSTSRAGCSTCAARTPSSGGRDFLDGGPAEATLPDAWWFRPDGRQMAQRDWQSPDTRELGVFLNGEETGIVDPRGEPVVDESFVVLLNADARAGRLPAAAAPLRARVGARALDRRPRRRRGALPGPLGARGAGALARPPQTRSLGTRVAAESRGQSTPQAIEELGHWPPPKRWPFARQMRKATTSCSWGDAAAGSCGKSLGSVSGPGADVDLHPAAVAGRVPEPVGGAMPVEGFVPVDAERLADPPVGKCCESGRWPTWP